MTLLDLVKVCTPTMMIEIQLKGEKILFMASDFDMWQSLKDKKITLISLNLRPLGIKVVVG